MSHELRTPLNAILGYTDLLLDNKLSPVDDVQKGCLENIQSAGRHMLSLVSDILDFAKIRQARLSLNPAAYDAEEVIEQPLRLTGVLADEKGLNIRVEGERDHIVYCDLLRAQQVLTNVLSNALKVSPEGAKIVLAVIQMEDGGTVMTITDEGPGMSPDQANQAMEPFVQLEDPMQKTHEGTGLGLPLSRELMRLHGGDLVLETALDQGTCVRLAFPPRST